MIITSSEGDIEKYKHPYFAFLEDFQKKNPDALQLEEIHFKTSVDRLKNLIDFYPLQTVVALHARKALLPFLKAACRFYIQSTDNKSPLKKILQNMAKKMKANAYDDEGFLKKLKEYSQIFKKQLFTGIKSQDICNYYEKDKRTLTFRELLKKLQKIQSEKQDHIRRTSLNNFIEEELLVQQPKIFLEEISLNWIKQTIQIYQNQKDYNLCCRVHFERYKTSQLSGFNESVNHEFKDYRWPLENDSIKFHLIKTFVGFLNTTGGIIFVGMKQDKNKIVQVKGIELSQQQKIDFLYFVHNQILSGVYPRDPDRQQDELQDQKLKSLNPKSNYKLKLKKELQRQKSKSQGYDFHISKYVSVDFIDVFDRKTYLNSHGEKHRLYIARIKIKKGNPRQLYHVINKHNIPQTFMREDKSVKRKDIKQFYDLFYKRISQSQMEPFQKQVDWHKYCRFNPNSVIQEEMKKEQ